MNKELFPERPSAKPMIYAYSDSNPLYKGLLKVGYTTIDVEKRVAQQYPTKRPDGSVPYEIVLCESAMKNDGSCFTDHDVHKLLRKKKHSSVGGEWFKCVVNDIMAVIVALRTGSENIENRTQTFEMRPEQKEAVDKTISYYASSKNEGYDRAPKFLWNAKMRFGKTFASYQLAKKMGMKKVLVLTFKPAVEAAWEEDLMTHQDFEGWQFICRGGLTYEQADLQRPIVCFGSFQDYLGTNENGGIKTKNEWVHTTNWDMIIFDEYHFGAWRDNAKKLFDSGNEDSDFDFDSEKYKLDEADNAYNETFLPITTDYYLFLSGTPFRAINSGEFIEEQIYNWTYSDEQKAKDNWGENPDNPYTALPRMVMLTYQIPDTIRQIAAKGENNEFGLNIFFSTSGNDGLAKFNHKNEVQKWLDLIRGAYLPSNTDDMKLAHDKRPPMPYSDTRLLNVLSHTFWFLPNIASCVAMKNLLEERQNVFFHDYNIILAAGTSAGIGVDALYPVQSAMGDPLITKTITLSCGKLTTGVTVRPWTGIFMLRDLSSPETYFQAAFRVQSPWEVPKGINEKEIMKRECYVFDFALDRALKQISDYSCRLNIDESNPEKKVAEFINFLPVLAYDGSTMRQIDAGDILDIAMAGTSASLLAKRWESALLVNVDNDTLARLMSNAEAMRALMSIEGFRNLNKDIPTIINKSDAVKKAKNESVEKLTKNEEEELTEKEKEYKSIRKQIQKNLIKFATRIPIFMYLTDYREYSLKDVITKLEPGLFKKVTGLEVEDFELLVSLNIFNGPLMNDAIYKFKRYEDSNLSYIGIDKHTNEDIGGWDTVIKSQEYQQLFFAQQLTMDKTEIESGFIPEVLDELENDEQLVEVSNELTRDEGIISKNIIPLRTIANLTEKSKVDVSWVNVGSIVIHKVFGEGRVLAIEKGLISVAFGKAEKKFQFPQAFENGFFDI